MARHHEIGKLGEAAAASYLEREGYEVLAYNWRHRRMEIDLVACKDGVLIFVEVKTRQKNEFHSAERSINQKKKSLLAEAASVYMEQHGHDWELRFDIIVVLYRNETAYDIQHYEDAFFPGWDGF